MESQELLMELSHMKIPLIYSINKIEEGKYCLILENGFWKFFFLENGKRKFFNFFPDENYACVFFKSFMVNNFLIKKDNVFHQSGFEKEPVYINGINIWEYKWIETEKWFLVKDPIRKKDYLFNSFYCNANSKTVEFIAGEFSNSIWGFYIIK